MNPEVATPDWYLTDEPFGTTLLVQTLDAFGPDCLHWAPETLREDFENRFNCLLMPENVDKLLAAVAIVTTDLFFKAVDRFWVLANALSGYGFDPVRPEPADIETCCWAVTEGFLLSPPDDEEPEPFSSQVQRYLGERLHEEGFLEPPGVLRFAIYPQQRHNVQDFDDQPEFWNAVQIQQGRKVQAVELEIQARLQKLFQQLEVLQLQEGSTKGLLSRLQRVSRPA